MPVKAGEQSASATVSAGVADFRPSGSWGETISRALAALACAKQGGRNQVRLAP